MFGFSKYNISLLFCLTLFISLQSCTRLNKCDDCIYLPERTQYFKAMHLAENSDTSYYDLKLHTSTSRFMFFQNSLKYELIRYKSYKRDSVEKHIYTTTGFTENNSRIWLHPPRSDKFKFITQLAPFPQIKLPVNFNDTIKGSIRMGSGWDEWKSKSTSYYITPIDSVFDPDLNETVYILYGCGTLENNESCVYRYFSKSKGFIKANYVFNDTAYFFLKLTDKAE
jgi:hypothetical protein